MILCEWKDFSTDTEVYTQDTFENLINDEFEAMMFVEDDEIPAYIWTINYVCMVKKGTRMIADISIRKIPRNPVCA